MSTIARREAVPSQNLNAGMVFGVKLFWVLYGQNISLVPLADWFAVISFAHSWDGLLFTSLNVHLSSAVSSFSRLLEKPALDEDLSM